MRTSRFRDDDEELVKAISEGNRDAVEYFFNRFENVIYSIIQNRSWADKQDINDIYNSFFLHLAKENFRRITAWRRQAALGTYTISLLKNYIRDYYKIRGHRPAGTEPIDENRPDDAHNPDALFDVKRLREYLVDAKKTLGERDREILCLRLFRDLEPAECARQLGLNNNAFYQAYHRAKGRLIDAFRRLYPLLFERDL